MRRWFAILLLALLPLQFSWAAVAGYCAHEEGPATHVGHHEHQHDADGSGDRTDHAGKLPGAADLDCDHCHGYCAAALFDAPAFASEQPAGRPAAGLVAAMRALAAAPPERPQWASLA